MTNIRARVGRAHRSAVRETEREDVLVLTCGCLVSLLGLLHDGVYRFNLTVDNELDKVSQSDVPVDRSALVVLIEHAYLLDYDPVDKHLYFAECAVPIRPIIMSCSKTRGIFRIDLRQAELKKQVSC